MRYMTVNWHDYERGSRPVCKTVLVLISRWFLDRCLPGHNMSSGGIIFQVLFRQNSKLLLYISLFSYFYIPFCLYLSRSLIIISLLIHILQINLAVQNQQVEFLPSVQCLICQLLQLVLQLGRILRISRITYALFAFLTTETRSSFARYKCYLRMIQTTRIHFIWLIFHLR